MIMIIRATVSLILILVATVLIPAPPGSAEEGEVLIDQAQAQAGGVTPDDDPGFPVTISRRGKYKLTGNLNVPAGQNGIDVTAGNVTLDLNNFRIFGNSRAS